jgi:hypothetical protein
MNENNTFISFVKSEQPRIWESIRNAADEGLIFIDEINDSVTPTNRLLLTYPDLHIVLNLLVDNWVRVKKEEFTSESIVRILREASESDG